MPTPAAGPNAPTATPIYPRLAIAVRLARVGQNGQELGSTQSEGSHADDERKGPEVGFGRLIDL